MAFYPLKLPPGVYRNGTRYQSQGRFYDADLWRWTNETQRPVGGWRAKSQSAAKGAVRAVLTWSDNENQAWIALGSHSTLSAMTRAGAIYDITPVRASAELTDPFATTEDETTVLVTDAGHDGVTGAYVMFSGASAVGGITLDGVYEMTVIDADTYTVEAADPATSDASGGGSVTADYMILPGRADAVAGGGFGTGPFGTGVFGAPRPDTTTVVPVRVWSLDVWGEELLACCGGPIYVWGLGPTDRAVAIDGAPEAEAILMTEERALIAIGADGDPRAVDWCDPEDYTDWTPTSTNLAGGRRLQTNGRLLCGKSVQGAYLIFSDADVHRGRFDGLPQVYRFERLATGCGVISKGAVAAADSRAWWMGPTGFWRYDGAVHPLPCEVADYVFGDLNRSQASKISAWHNSQFTEVWFLYPSSGSLENDRYVTFNHVEGHWGIGRLDRLCGCDKTVLAYPLMIGADGIVYEHEVGQQRDGRSPYAISGPIELGNGDRTMLVQAIIPDQSNLGDVAATFTVQDYPMSEAAEHGPFAMSDKTDCRFSGRSVAVRFEAAPEQDFRLGLPRFDVKPGSPR